MTCEVQTSDGPKIYRACYRKSHRIAMTIADVDAADLPSDLQCVIEKDDVLGENLYAEHSDLKRAIANYAIDIKEMNTETAKLRAAKYGNRR